jgi:hypothetical protein
MATIDNSCFWLVNFFKSSSLKLLSQMNRNLVGRVYGIGMKCALFIEDLP